MTVRWTVRAADRALRRVQVAERQQGRKRNGENCQLLESLNRGTDHILSARIPLQSPPCGGDSFPSGEALAGGSVTLPYSTITGKGGAWAKAGQRPALTLDVNIADDECGDGVGGEGGAEHILLHS